MSSGWAPICFNLPYRGPLDAEGLLAFLARRAVPGVEAVADGSYRRSLRLEHGPGTVELRIAAEHVEARFRLADERDLHDATRRARRLFDLDHDPADVADALGDDPLIGALVRAVPGRRVPGSADGHELAVRAVLGQQISVAGAATLAGRLVTEHGRTLAHPLGAVTHVFPSAEALSRLDPETVAMPRVRGRALRGLSQTIASGALRLEAEGDPAATRRGLLALAGIGPWTADYIAMRVLRDADAFLPSDLGVRRALERLGEDGSPTAAERLADRWRPYRAYALMYLWGSLADGGG